MQRILLSLMIAVPLVVAAADSPSRIQTKRIDPTVEDLAHSFFYHTPQLEERLASIVSPQGVRAVSSAAIEHNKMMNDRDVVIGKVRQICAELKNARTGEEFAEVFTRFDERDRAEKRQHGAQLLARLDQYDRMALENYLNTKYRESGTTSVMDYYALFATGPFPSDYSRRIMRDACEREPPPPPAELLAQQATDQSRNIQSSVADTTKRPGLNGDTPSTTADTSATARDARAKEPSDPSWAHYMEQALSHYLASHPKASQFDITSVNCRSSFCEVVAVGFDESTWPVWQQVMYDGKQQPWSEFGQIGSSLESREGRVILNATLHRLPRE